MASSVVGNLTIIKDFKMDELNTLRTIRVWVPFNYDKNVSYPVIYMHDGQNLFDNQTSFAGEWQVDENIEDMIKEDKIKGFIVVGIDNSINRMEEYTPDWIDTPKALGGKYGKFIVNTLKPYIDANYNTLKDKENTFIIGSSMGGLISFYIGLKYHNIFGNVGCLSSSFQINSVESRNNFIDSLEITNDFPNLYLDAGTLEHSQNYLNDVKSKLIKQGYNENKVITKVYEDHGHNELYWAKRFKTIIILLTKM